MQYDLVILYNYLRNVILSILYCITLYMIQLITISIYNRISLKNITYGISCLHLYDS